MGLSTEEFLTLSEEKVRNFSEKDKLRLALLDDYDTTKSYQILGETGIIYPGYAIYEVDFHELYECIVLPKGDYCGTFVLTGYSDVKKEFSNFDMCIPVTIHVEENLPQELQEQFGDVLACDLAK